jgi:hypothetical protein
MTIVSLDKRTIERFSYYMTFFEHALNLKDNDIVARRLVAPDFDDFKSIKKRVAQVMLKALRSSALFDFPQTFESENMEFTLKSIARWRKQEEELERYMRFILEVDAKCADVDMFPYDPVNQGPDMTVITDPEVRDRFFEGVVQGATNDNRRETPEVQAPRMEFIQHMKDNYEIVLCTGLHNYDRNPLGGINVGDDNVTISARDVKFNALQDHIDTQGSEYCNRYGQINLTNFIKKFHKNVELDDGPDSWARDRNPHNYYTDTYPLIPRKVWQANDVVQKLGDDNIFIKIRDDSNRGYGRREVQTHDGMIILAKKIQDGDTYKIVPNLIRKTIRYDIRYSRDALMNPEMFMNVNRQLVDNFTNRYRRDTDDAVTE